MAKNIITETIDKVTEAITDSTATSTEAATKFVANFVEGKSSVKNDSLYSKSEIKKMSIPTDIGTSKNKKNSYTKSSQIAENTKNLTPYSDAYKVMSNAKKRDKEREKKKNKASYNNTSVKPLVNKYITINTNKYPKKKNTKKDWYDTNVNYEISLPKNITNAVKQIKQQMGIPTAYSKNTINKYTHVYFNRYRMEFPDLYLKNTKGVIIMTRPDLNIFSSKGNVKTQIKENERCYGILKRGKILGNLLTRKGHYGSTLDKHNFNPLLSNLIQGLEVQDDNVDVVETGETFNGFKMQYAKHNIKSITAGQVSLKFKETMDLAVTSLHQIWVDYISGVYIGTMSPKESHIWNRELDYACNIYYFLLAEDGETILFWTKYYGCFPTNVPKSSFSFDYSSDINLPDVSVNYNYIYRSDLSTRALIEFNMDGGLQGTGYKYLANYNSNMVVSTPWAGVPYIDKVTVDTGVSSKATHYKLRYRDKSK